MTRRFVLSRLLIVAASAGIYFGFTAHAASAASITYVTCTGIAGTSTRIHRKDWIELNSFELSVGQNPSASLTKFQDAASPRLMQDATTGAVIPKCTVELVKEGGTQETPYLRYEMDGVLISGYKMTASGTRAIESMNLKFKKIITTQAACNASGVCTMSTPASRIPSRVRELIVPTPRP